MIRLNVLGNCGDNCTRGQLYRGGSIICISVVYWIYFYEWWWLESMTDDDVSASESVWMIRWHYHNKWRWGDLNSGTGIMRNCREWSVCLEGLWERCVQVGGWEWTGLNWGRFYISGLKNWYFWRLGVCSSWRRMRSGRSVGQVCSFCDGDCGYIWGLRDPLSIC